jgi:hypothetical protein
MLAVDTIFFRDMVFSSKSDPDFSFVPSRQATARNSRSADRRSLMHPVAISQAFWGKVTVNWLGLAN